MFGRWFRAQGVPGDRSPGAAAHPPGVRIALLLGGLILLGAGFYGWRADAEPIGRPTKTLYAFGYVEDVDLSGEGCRVRVALYDWVNLSPDFPLNAIPRRNDRFLLNGRGDDCLALAVATAATDQHIAFEAGEWRGRWWFVRPPSAAVGCGGLTIDWRPEPE